MILRYIYGGRLSLEEYDTSDIIKILIASIWEHVLKWGIAQNPELSSDLSNYSKDDFTTLKNTLQRFIPFIDFFNLTSIEYLDKVYPYKKIIPKDLHESLFKYFMGKPNNNQSNMTKEVDSMAISSIQKNLSIEKDFNIIVDEIHEFIYKLMNEVFEYKSVKQKVIEYFNDHNINSQETYNWLLNNQIRLAQYFVGNCYKYGYGTIKNENLSFEYYKKAANKNYARAQFAIGDCYINGIGIEKDYNKAFGFYKQSVENGFLEGIIMFRYCYDEGIGTKIDKQKAVELYQNAANLGESTAQYNLALMYENGNGIIKDIDKAIYWYEKSAKQGDEDAQNRLKYFKKIVNL
ncbi:kinase-like domain-containing protein [Rhizophagus clarus]|uniref:Kinase-like domain-containing protein n=1 Tax=Rhizophagus clarus TaxID=94130 RepID=A0A8H3LDS3_9GLOM|nr:kinase-like domain-containing protein [Rhizophagus clarus]